MEREQLKRNLEAAGCQIIEENDKGIIASCRNSDFEEMPREMKRSKDVIFNIKDDDEA